MAASGAGVPDAPISRVLVEPRCCAARVAGALLHSPDLETHSATRAETKAGLDLRPQAPSLSPNPGLAAATPRMKTEPWSLGALRGRRATSAQDPRL